MNKTITIYIALALLIVPSIHALTIHQFQPGAVNGTDAQINAGARTTNYETGTVMYMGFPAGGDLLRSLINGSFWCSSIPEVQDIENVTLELAVFQSDSTSDNFTLYAMNHSWQEDNITWNGCGDGGNCTGWYNDSYVVGHNELGVVGGSKVNITINQTFVNQMCGLDDEELNPYGIILIHDDESGAVVNVEGFDTSDGTTKPSWFVTTSEGIDNCSSNSHKSVNVFLRNSSDNSIISSSMTKNMEFLLEYERSGADRNYSTSSQDNNLSFCLPDSDSSFLVDLLIDYSVGGTSYEYSKNSINFSGTAQNIDIYTTTGSTQVTFEVFDENDDAVKDALIHIKLFDVGTNSFTTTEIVQTDSNGIALGHIILNSEFYEFEVEFEGEIIYTDAKGKRTATEYEFRVQIGTPVSFITKQVAGLDIDFNANRLAKAFDLNWTTIGGIASMILFEVRQTNTSGDFVIYAENSTNTTGSMYYNLTSPYNNSGRYVGTVHVIAVEDGKKYYVAGDDIDIRKAYEVLGDKETVLMTFLFVGTMAFIGLAVSAELGILLSILGMLVFWWMGFFMAGFGAMIGLFCSLLIMLVRVRRR